MYTVKIWLACCKNGEYMCVEKLVRIETTKKCIEILLNAPYKNSVFAEQD